MCMGCVRLAKGGATGHTFDGVLQVFVRRLYVVLVVGRLFEK